MTSSKRLRGLLGDFLRQARLQLVWVVCLPYAVASLQELLQLARLWYLSRIIIQRATEHLGEELSLVTAGLP